MSPSFDDVYELIANQKAIIAKQETIISNKEIIIQNQNKIISNNELIEANLNRIIALQQEKIEMLERKINERN